MTRDEAIDKVLAVDYTAGGLIRLSANETDSNLVARTRNNAALHVDRLVALGLLKLDEPTEQRVSPDRAKAFADQLHRHPKDLDVLDISTRRRMRGNKPYLLTCPFCGGEPTMHRVMAELIVECLNAECREAERTACVVAVDATQAANKWNLRQG